MPKFLIESKESNTIFIIGGFENVSAKIKLYFHIQNKFPDVKIFDGAWSYRSLDKVDLLTDGLNLLFGNEEDLNRLYPNDRPHVAKVSDVSSGVFIQTSMANTFKLDDYLNQITISSEKVTEKHKCNCPLRSLLSNGCRCGGV